MKKLLFVLSLFAFASAFAQVNFTVIKKDGVTLDSVVTYLNPKGIQNVDGSFINYQDYNNAKNVVKIKVTENIDTIYKRLNFYHPEVIKLWAVTPIYGTSRDTIKPYLYPIASLNSYTSMTSTTLPKAKSLLYLSQCDGYKKLYIRETPAQIKSRRDSLVELSKDAFAYVYDTSNYTVKTYDKHIILKSTTADTLTLLNPNLFINRSPIVVANIGSGAYTIAGGFTVKDKSASNVTSLTANTVYTFKAYYDGSAYIWLKEY